ncbi:hypothetical protein H2248_002371 [Termitomyces sp. 'cryptogamus']|nr:hypothetical protein H2248_002371 [Termitomyces sp. 'cryptogamus']
MIVCEPRCMACGRSDHMLRAEAANSQGSDPSPIYLKACCICNLAFYCSESHWDAVRHHHAEEACEDGHDGLTQCQMNIEVVQDIKLTKESTMNKSMGFWALERIKSSWESLQNTSWEDEFLSEIAQKYGGSTETARSRVRFASVGLSMPMTILWALEHLNPDALWTQSETLTIHILGAADTEMAHAKTFEEILHRLPELKMLQVSLTTPHLALSSLLVGCSMRARGSQTSEKRDADLKCTSRKCKIIQHYSARTYHDCVRTLGNKFMKPNLAAAFNSGSSLEDTWLWKETMSLLVENKVPSVFTAYNQNEAQGEARILRAMGANLVPALGSVKNVWGSISSGKKL